jgi:AhpD family alkylhydroperoxidase
LAALADPPADEALTEWRRASLVDPAWSKSAYFRLLARDPDILEARTRTDKDIFYNTSSGLQRTERELAAAATSRHHGCIYRASVHARHATTYSKRPEDVQRLLDVGVRLIWANAGTRSSPLRWRSRRPRSCSVRPMSPACCGTGRRRDRGRDQRRGLLQPG